MSERATRALAALERCGGAAGLPDVLKSTDVVSWMGRGWFSDALRLRIIPGMQVRPGGVWRCDRDTFLAWMRELAGAEGPGAEGAEGEGAEGGAAPSARSVPGPDS